jgi:hypothetical protein
MGRYPFHPRGRIVADDSTPGSGGSGAGPFFDFIAQLRRMADQLDMTKNLGMPMPAVPTMPALGSLPMLPPPGALSAAQLSAMNSAVAAQRGSIEGLISQLRAFDEQLEVLERILGPLAEWSRTWADVERTMMPPGTAG